ncbi:MAG: hypothetical protein MPK06_04685 [Alphaproteobacteria bacterium]|nr:hypothetical protein [Alphaproteobacteria bacterium]MDA8004460.1 hypothetical protein [Alphaproteobacteria bacterium]MDA8005817.1 hypothetical protein [Alphaproteobacteria bacterium]MDA8013780.1 hypothetical protein [Alphaproteobacteria bacterium]
MFEPRSLGMFASSADFNAALDGLTNRDPAAAEGRDSPADKNGGDIFFRKATRWQRHPVLPGFSGARILPVGGNSIPDPQVLHVLEPPPPDDRAELLPSRRALALTQLSRAMEKTMTETTTTTEEGVVGDALVVLEKTRDLLLEASTRRIQLLSC